jgi:pimeloyl-ACP methyl ester carboxylesterase
LLTTASTELHQIKALGSDGSRYAAITAPVLLLGGGRSPGYCARSITRLAEILPQAKLVTTPEFNHNAPDIGAPAAVADLIRA